jgi:hypothetical protein
LFLVLFALVELINRKLLCRKQRHMGMTFLYSVKVASLIFPSMDSTKVV